LFSDCPVKEITDIGTGFQFECLKEYFKCLNFDVQKAIDIFNLEGTDGIDNMILPPGNDCDPDFIVR